MYIPAFDTFNTIYRMLHVLRHFEGDDIVEVDRLRIFDFYLLFPYRAYGIHLRQREEDFRSMRAKYIEKKANPYNMTTNDRRLFERLRAYQMIALSHLASYGLIDPGMLLQQKVRVADADKMRNVMAQLDKMPADEDNVLAWLSHCFRHTPLGGEYGLRYRTQLLESKYDV